MIKQGAESERSELHHCPDCRRDLSFVTVAVETEGSFVTARSWRERSEFGVRGTI